MTVFHPKWRSHTTNAGLCANVHPPLDMSARARNTAKGEGGGRRGRVRHCRSWQRERCCPGGPSWWPSPTLRRRQAAEVFLPPAPAASRLPPPPFGVRGWLLLATCCYCRASSSRAVLLLLVSLGGRGASFAFVQAKTGGGVVCAFQPIMMVINDGWAPLLVYACCWALIDISTPARVQTARRAAPP
jgi:hypothetical protein